MEITLLLPRWLLGFSPDPSGTGGSRENNFHMSVWNLRLQKNALWSLQRARNLPALHDFYLLGIRREDNGGFHG